MGVYEIELLKGPLKVSDVLMSSMERCIFIILSESSEKRKTGCQAVCILLEGGPNSAETLYSSLAKKVPCVVASNSGRASDIITYAKENTKYEM